MMAVLDGESLKKQPVEALRKRIVELGADWHPAEKKADLLVRVAQLEGAPDIAEKIKREMANAGFAKENKPIYQAQARLSKEEIDKILKPYKEKGLKYKISPDGESWAMKFDTGRVLKYARDRVPVIVEDSGSTTIPPKVLSQCAQLLLQQRRAPKVTKTEAEFVDADEDAA